MAAVILRPTQFCICGIPPSLKLVSLHGCCHSVSNPSLHVWCPTILETHLAAWLLSFCVQRNLVFVVSRYPWNSLGCMAAVILCPTRSCICDLPLSLKVTSLHGCCHFVSNTILYLWCPAILEIHFAAWLLPFCVQRNFIFGVSCHP